MSALLLRGLKVIEIGNGYSSAIAGMLLADYGAEVIQIHTDEESSMAPHVAAVLNRNKREHPQKFSTIEKETLAEILSEADICIESVQSDISLKIRAAAESQESLIHCRMPMFPEGHANESWPVSEESIAASTMQYEAPGGLGTPEKYYFPIVSYMTGSFGVNGIVMALHSRLQDGKGQVVEIPHYDVGFYANMLLTISLHHPPKCWKIFKMLASPFIGVWRTSDENFIYLHLGVSRHVPIFFETLKKSGMRTEAEKIESLLSDHTKNDTTDFATLKEAKAVYEGMKELMLSKSSDYWEETLGSVGICCNKTRSLEEWSATDCFNAIAGSVSLGERKLFAPKPAISVNGALPDLTEEQQTENTPLLTTESESSAPLGGVRIIDMARVVAGPLAGKVLTEAGAEVMQVWKTGDFQYWESAMFMLYNGGKKSVQVDIKSEKGAKDFDAILEGFKPHVILHNYAPEAAAKLGLDFDALSRKCPGLVFMNVTAFNNRSDFAKRRGFEQTIQAISGIQREVGGEGLPKFLAVLINDVNTGLNASFGVMAALYSQKIHGRIPMNLHTSLDTPALMVQLEKLNAPNEAEQEFIESREMRNRFFQAKDDLFFLSCDSSALEELIAHCSTKESEEKCDDLCRSFERYFKSFKVDQLVEQFRHNRGIRIIKRIKLNAFAEEMLNRENPGAVRRWFKGIGWYTESLIPINLSGTPLVKHGGTVPLGYHTEEVLKGNYSPQISEVKPDVNDRRGLGSKISGVIQILKQAGWIVFHKKKA